MRRKKLGLKVSLIVSGVIMVVVASTIWIVMVQTNLLVNNLAKNEAEAANTSIVRTIEDMQNTAYERANIIAHSYDIINAVTDGDAYTLKRTLTTFMSGLDFITLCDEKGNVLVRAHSDQRGDNVSGNEMIAAALSKASGASTIVREGADRLATSAVMTITSHSGYIIGAVQCGHDLSLEKYVDEIKERSNCDVTIFNYDMRMSTTILNENGERAVGSRGSEIVIENVIDKRQDYEDRISLFDSDYYAYYSPIIVDDQIIGMLYTGVNIDEALQNRSSMIKSILLIILACGVLCIILIFGFSAIAISRPLELIGGYAEKIHNGDLGISSGETAVIDFRSSDEIGTVARILEGAYIELRNYIVEIKERMQNLSEGDLMTESSFDFRGDFVLIKDSFNNIVQTLNQTMQEVNTSASQVAASSVLVAEGAQILAQGATSQAASVEELSSFVTEIMEQTSHNADVAREATRLSGDIRTSAEDGSRQMDDMVLAIREINQASGQIGKVIKVIDDIAFQTNILALNAAVEAARAGEHGKGFAVVADEVRDLATKSAVAAKDTERLIADSVAKANLGLSIAIETAESLKKIVEDIIRSAEIVEQIALSSDEQASAIANVNAGIEQVANVVQQNNATAERSASASEEMSGQSVMLRKMISYFRINK